MSYKYQLAFTYFIDQEPIWRDMTLAGSQSAFVTLLRCASRRDSPSDAKLVL